jgi:hypothetical protein
MRVSEYRSPESCTRVDEKEEPAQERNCSLTKCVSYDKCQPVNRNPKTYIPISKLPIRVLREDKGICRVEDKDRE